MFHNFQQTGWEEGWLRNGRRSMDSSQSIPPLFFSIFMALACGLFEHLRRKKSGQKTFMIPLGRTISMRPPYRRFLPFVGAIRGQD